MASERVSRIEFNGMVGSIVETRSKGFEAAVYEAGKVREASYKCFRQFNQLVDAIAWVEGVLNTYISYTNGKDKRMSSSAVFTRKANDGVNFPEGMPHNKRWTSPELALKAIHDTFHNPQCKTQRYVAAVAGWALDPNDYRNVTRINTYLLDGFERNWLIAVLRWFHATHYKDGLDISGRWITSQYMAW